MINTDSRNVLKKWDVFLYLCYFSDWGVSYSDKVGISWSCRLSFYCLCRYQGALNGACWELPFLSRHLLILLGFELTLTTWSGIHPKFPMCFGLRVSLRLVCLHLFFKKAVGPVLWKRSYNRRARSALYNYMRLFWVWSSMLEYVWEGVWPTSEGPAE